MTAHLALGIGPSCLRRRPPRRSGSLPRRDRRLALPGRRPLRPWSRRRRPSGRPTLRTELQHTRRPWRQCTITQHRGSTDRGAHGRAVERSTRGRGGELDVRPGGRRRAGRPRRGRHQGRAAQRRPTACAAQHAQPRRRRAQPVHRDPQPGQAQRDLRPDHRRRVSGALAAIVADGRRLRHLEPGADPSRSCASTWRTCGRSIPTSSTCEGPAGATRDPWPTSVATTWRAAGPAAAWPTR